MYTLQKAHVLTKIITLIFITTFSVSYGRSSYENYELPKKKGTIPLLQGDYKTSKFDIKRKSETVKPSYNHQKFLAEKEAFLTEKRDEAIKLLRQQIAVGYTQNLPNMLLRLGQLYTEKYTELSYYEHEIYSAKLKAYEKLKAKNPKALPPKFDTSRSRAYLKDALKIFHNLEKKYSRHPKMDEIVFFIGFVELELGNKKKGVSYLERLIKNYPFSKKFDEAVISLGDYYFDLHLFKEAASKFELLLKRKNINLSYYARYKLAWCHLNTQRKKHALNEMKNLILELKESAEKEVFNLKGQALKDLIIFYGEVGSSEDAFNFFSKEEGKKTAIQNLKLIGDILRSKAYDIKAIEAYNLFLAQSPNDLEAPYVEMGIFDCLTRLGRYEDAAKQMNRMMVRFGPNSEFAKNYPLEKKEVMEDIISNIEKESFKMATFHHSAAQKGKNKAHYNYALYLYDSILKTFPNHKERKKLTFYKGEILFNQKKWLEASSNYLECFKIAPKDTLSHEALYNALISLDNLTYRESKLERIKGDSADIEKRDIPQAEKKFIEIAQTYLSEYPNSAKAIDIKFRIASIYYQYRHYDKAKDAFFEIATNYPKHKGAVSSAHIVLDIYNMEKKYDELSSTAMKFSSIRGLGDKRFKDEMAKLISEVRFKKIEFLEKNNEWEKAAMAYFDVYKSNPGGPLAEKSLYNSIVSFEKANNMDKTEEVIKLFIKKYPSSPYTEKYFLKLAINAEVSYEFDTAYKLYNDFYKKFPSSKEAKKALYNAALFAEITERNELALKLYREYLRVANPTKNEKEAILLSEAKLLRKIGNFREMNLIYRKLAKESGSEKQKYNFIAELANQYERLGKHKEKEAIANELYYAYLSSPQKLPEKALPYVAQVFFKKITPKRESYYKIQLRFPPQDLVYLLKLKQKKLISLDKAYDEVINLGVPSVGVAALYEKSVANSHLVESFRQVKIPSKYKGESLTELKKELDVIDNSVIKPIETVSKEVLSACVKKASEYYVDNEYAEKCHSMYYKTDGPFIREPLIPKTAYWSLLPSDLEVALK